MNRKSAFCVAILMLAGCSARTAPSLVPAAASIAHPSAARYVVLHTFRGRPDGENPNGGLIELGGVFYGTTISGGRHNSGALYSITPNGTESVVYSFGADSRDASGPDAELVALRGRLYGISKIGGTYGKGAVFSVTRDGTERVVHSFGKGTDGTSPGAGLMVFDGTLYGTTTKGGAYDKGVVYSLTPSGTETVLHSFGKGKDGFASYSALIAANGTLFGTTCRGGAFDDGGTIYSITPAGYETVLRSFKRSGPGGWCPRAALARVKTALYGVNVFGGTHNRGTAFKIGQKGGGFGVLHAFGKPLDGETPVTALINANGTLYGVTPSGGANDRGTVYKLTTAGTERVIYSFSGISLPKSQLLRANGKFYGTILGSHLNGGPGLVYSVTP